MKKKIIIIISWLLVAIWMGVIYSFSNVKGEESTNDSRKIIEKTVEKTVETTNKTGITNTKPSEETLKKVSKSLDYPFRKAMHIFVYFVLSILTLNALYQSGVKKLKLFIIAFIICFVYSLTDEYHQLFRERTGEFKDCLIDSIGIIIGLILYKIGLNIYNKKVKNIKSN